MKNTCKGDYTIRLDIKRNLDGPVKVTLCRDDNSVADFVTVNISHELVEDYSKDIEKLFNYCNRINRFTTFLSTVKDMCSDCNDRTLESLNECLDKMDIGCIAINLVNVTVDPIQTKVLTDYQELDSSVMLRFLKSLPDSSVGECKSADDLVDLILRLS